VGLDVKCCADWFVRLSVFLFIASVKFMFVKSIHLSCVSLSYTTVSKVVYIILKWQEDHTRICLGSLGQLDYTADDTQIRNYTHNTSDSVGI